ncbi:MAG: wax ester/triacylglycerol synthase family O-acyltransferase, partial [Chloroflexota bacterium]
MTAGPRPSGRPRLAEGRRWLPAGRRWLPALAAGAVTIVIAAGCVGAGPSGGSPAVTAARPSTPIAT